MISATLTLDRMHCHAQADNFSSSEPYLWTVFFHGDINTASLGLGFWIATDTPHAKSTARGLFPGDVDAGDDVSIPTSMGRKTVILDDGGLGFGLFGVLSVLLEQDQTPSDAIRAGHEALGEATDVALNDFLIQTFPDVNAPTDDQIQVVADEIQGEVKDAIRDKLSWYHLLHDQDDVFGFGFRMFLYEDLIALADRPQPKEEFTARIQHTKNSGPNIDIFNDYEIFGNLTVRNLEPPAETCRDELLTYQKTVSNLKNIDETIEQTKAQVATSAGSEKLVLLAELEFLRDEVRPSALEALAQARAAYQACRDKFSGTTKAYLDAKAELLKSRENRRRGRRPSIFRPSASLASLTTYRNP